MKKLATKKNIIIGSIGVGVAAVSAIIFFNRGKIAEKIADKKAEKEEK